MVSQGHGAHYGTMLPCTDKSPVDASFIQRELSRVLLFIMWHPMALIDMSNAVCLCERASQRISPLYKLSCTTWDPGTQVFLERFRLRSAQCVQ